MVMANAATLTRSQTDRRVVRCPDEPAGRSRPAQLRGASPEAT